MTIRSRGARIIPNAARRSETVRLAFISRQESRQKSREEPEYGDCTTKVQSHRKAATKSSATSHMLDTVMVTFADGPAKPEPVVSTGDVERDAAFDFTGTPSRTIVFSALPEPAHALKTASRIEVRQMSPYSGVSSLSCCRVLPVARVLHAPR